MRRLGVLVAAALVLAATAVTPARARGSGELVRFDDTRRPYVVYVPRGVGANRPLVVHLHGCNQDAADAVTGSRWVQLADEHRFVVAFPEQPVAYHGTRCWNWYLPEHQERGAGEAAIIAEITEKVVNRYRTDPGRTYLNGISAGGAMTSVMAATYPELYDAIGVVAGVSYRSDSAGAVTWEAMGEHARTMPAFIVHGTIDQVVPYPAATASASAWLGVADLADNGAADASVSRQPVANDNTGTDQTPSPGSGDPCLHPTRLPCAGGIAGLREYPATSTRWDDAAGRPLVELLSIHGAGHSHTGGDPAGNWTDPLGPGESAAAWAFFERVAAGWR